MNLSTSYRYDLPKERDETASGSIGDEIVSTALRALRKPDIYGAKMARTSILSAYEQGFLSPEQAYDALLADDLFGELREWLKAYAVGQRVLALLPGGDATPLNEIVGALARVCRRNASV